MSREPVGLLDTSTLILLADLDEQHLPEAPMISAVTLAELSVGPLVAQDHGDRARRQAHVQMAEADFDPMPFGTAAARAFGAVASGLRGRGRKPAARAFDALIAATAIAEGVPVFTCNPRDFEGIDGLDVRAVPVP